ncbi:helix-turn-helix domain-containing protein [Parvularcula maris]|uniref:Helix-turn-helix domain-containing protein n=1 Tax=Parvularcula maris TaxID=2965077 RepID=A0A9X2RJJ5_9PROT|nr:helix-turn-helix transcriptional regulator [Parvularcula maris]MCQ8185911.1 helix-turn-helix domain-containing protein [Parvularcula maris]
MPHQVDLHVGQRLRQRRCLLGMTQQKLADAVGIKFQQIQKYESGANRISASRLWVIARSLEVPVSYFFEGMTDEERALHTGETEDGMIAPEVLQQKETIDLIRAYYNLKEEPRRRFLDLAKTLADTAA